MKTKVIFLNVLFSLIFQTSMAQTIAVPNMSTTGLRATPEIAAKLTRYELVKIDKYKVLDEFDMNETLKDHPEFQNCYGKSCLIEIGKALKVDYILSGSVDGLGNKIVIHLKLIDVKAESLIGTKSLEFDNQEQELQRMIGIAIEELHGLPVDEVTKKRLSFKEEYITSNNVGKINNSGPRIGASYVAFGELNNFFRRKESQGGLGIQPFMTNIGYQFEGQYIGTENFSALFEVILNVGGMDQGQFIPSINFLNGFRFGKSGWEFAFGPGIGFRRTTKGLFDGDNYYRDFEWEDRAYQTWLDDSTNYNVTTGEVYNPFVAPNDDQYSRHLDSRGDIEFNANWIMGVGRTFRSGALNIPVNLYYSRNKYGGTIGFSLGFNVVTAKKSINEGSPY